MKHFLLIFLFGLLSFQLSAQEDKSKGDKEGEEKEKTFKENLFFGGTIWAQISRFRTQVEVAPVVGYHISPRFDAGIGARYIYYHTNTDYLISDAENTNKISNHNHIFGGSVFTRYVIIKNLDNILPFNIQGRFISHFEYEALNMPSAFDIDTQRSSSRFWAHNYLVGGGLQQKIGKKAYLNLLILYNLNKKDYSLYDNPIIRIGINF